MTGAVPTPPKASPLTAVYSLGRRIERARASRCCTPADPELDWCAYYVESNAKIREIRDWFNSLRPVVRDRIAGEIDDLFEQAAQGHTNPAAGDRPIDSFDLADDYFELRLTLTPDSDGAEPQLFRHYHFEPGVPHQDSLIALHAHLKDINGTREDVRAWQTAEMQYAIQRCQNGRSRTWGFPGDSGDLVNLLLNIDPDAP